MELELELAVEVGDFVLSVLVLVLVAVKSTLQMEYEPGVEPEVRLKFPVTTANLSGAYSVMPKVASVEGKVATRCAMVALGEAGEEMR